MQSSDDSVRPAFSQPATNAAVGVGVGDGDDDSKKHKSNHAVEIKAEEEEEADPAGLAHTHPRNDAQAATSTPKRTVCDHCRRRRIRCDGQFPCQQCQNASLTCKREHVPKKRGPKRGHGRVINELRARETKVAREPESASNSDVETDYYPSAPTSAAPSPPPASFMPWTAASSDPRHAPEPKSPYSTDAYRPTTQSFLHFIPKCVDLYYEHIYPIMPLLYMPTLRAIIARPLSPSEKNLVYALCALTSFHMSGRSLSAPGPPSWETVGRFFLDECISIRQAYDFLEDLSLNAVVSSFWLSTSFFEINQSRKSWYYLREALNLAVDLKLHDDSVNVGLSPEEILCRQRTFWILFVTERSFAVLRNKPLTLRKTPSLPTTKHSYESMDIHAGFLKLVSSYVPLDESFVNAWNDGSDPRMSATTYLNLQQVLAQPLDFLKPRRRRPSNALSIEGTGKKRAVGDEPQDEDPEPTAIQKADLMVTQQWLRLIVWQSSFRQGLLSTAASHESMAFSFPLAIARDTASILQSLPSHAVEVHGMGIFEKIFEIGTWCVNVLGAYDSGGTSPHRPFGGAADGVANMDFVGGELALFSHGGRGGAILDPLEFFVKTLSASPNSRKMFAEKLLLFAGERPGGMRMSLSPALSAQTSSSSATEGAWSGGGTVIGEVNDEKLEDEALGMLDAAPEQVMGDSMSGIIPGPEPRVPNGTGLHITTGSSGMSMPDDSISAGVSAFSDMGGQGVNDYGFGGTFTGPASGVPMSSGRPFMTDASMTRSGSGDEARTTPRGQIGSFPLDTRRSW